MIGPARDGVTANHLDLNGAIRLILFREIPRRILILCERPNKPHHFLTLGAERGAKDRAASLMQIA